MKSYVHSVISRVERVIRRQLLRGNRFARREEGRFERTSQDRRMYGDKRGQPSRYDYRSSNRKCLSFKHLLTIQTHNVTRNMETRGWSLNNAGFLMLGWPRGIAAIKTIETRSKEEEEARKTISRECIWLHTARSPREGGRKGGRGEQGHIHARYVPLDLVDYVQAGRGI